MKPRRLTLHAPRSTIHDDPWLRRDLACNWHPYTQMKDCVALPPLLIERARGTKLFTADGRWFHDTIASWWCNVHGHARPELGRALRRQFRKLDHVLFAGCTHQPAIELSEALLALAPPNLKRVFYSDNGSTAVEVAMKMSLQYWRLNGAPRKRRFVSLDRAYHGDTCGAMSLGGVSPFTRPFQPLFPRQFKAPSPYCYRCPMGRSRPRCGIACLAPLARLLRQRHAEIAALVLEPLLMAAGGMIVQPVEYLRGAARLARRHDVHLILDEVATGCGRTGRFFACEHAGVKPDFLALAKGLTAGTLPLGATLTTERIFRAFYADYSRQRTFYHGHTYTANPLACAVALASLELFRKDRTLAQVRRLAPVLRRGLERCRELPIVGDVRQIGLVGALELVMDRKTKRPFPPERRIGMEVYRRGLERHLLLRPLGAVIYLFPPLAISRRDLVEILDALYLTLREVGS